VAEAHRERVHPEQLGELGVAHGDVAGDALAEADPAEDAQCAGELLLAMQALLLDRGEGGGSSRLTGLGVSSIPSIVRSSRSVAVMSAAYGVRSDQAMPTRVA
jgi:hypothetical protein